MDNFLYVFVIIFCVTNANSLNAEGPNRILHGLNANENQFPYMVSLQRISGINTATRGHKCGGVLVTLQHALTAASCTLELRNGQMLPINRDEYRVFAGSVFLTNDTSPNRVRRIANTTAHPDYNITNNFFINNIAVIILGTPFLNNTVATLSVRSLGITEMAQCNITGWGNNTRLLHGRIQTVPNTLCSTFAPPSLPNMLCGMYDYNTSPIRFSGCPGDEGGPLVCQNELVALIVDIRACTNTSESVHWYIRVARFSTWLNSTIALPIPELGPEPTTVPPPTTLPPATLPPATTSFPGAASTFQPGMAVLAMIAIVQIISANIMN